MCSVGSKTIGRAALLLLVCWCLWSLAGHSAALCAQEQPQASAPSLSPGSLAEEVAQAVQMYPGVRPLLERLLSRLDSILTLLKEPQASLVVALSNSRETIGTLKRQVMDLQAELTASKNSQTNSAAAWAQERGELQARILAEQGLRKAAEQSRDIAWGINAGQAVGNIAQAVAHILRK